MINQRFLLNLSDKNVQSARGEAQLLFRPPTLSPDTRYLPYVAVIQADFESMAVTYLASIADVKAIRQWCDEWLTYITRERGDPSNE